MIYLICSFILCSVVWLIATKNKISFYTNVALLVTGIAVVFVQKNIQLGVILCIMLTYFCFMYKNFSSKEQSNIYVEIIRYLPLSVVLGYCLILNNKIPLKTEPEETSIAIASFISMLSIFICFAGVKIAGNKTKGDRDYD